MPKTDYEWVRDMAKIVEDQLDVEATIEIDYESYLPITIELRNGKCLHVKDSFRDLKEAECFLNGVIYGARFGLEWARLNIF